MLIHQLALTLMVYFCLYDFSSLHVRLWLTWFCSLSIYFRLRTRGKWRNTFCRFVIIVFWSAVLGMQQSYLIAVFIWYSSLFLMMSICLMLFVNVKVVITMGRSSFLQSTPLNLQESGWDFGCFSYPQNFNWSLLASHFIFLIFLNVAFTESIVPSL